MAGSKYKYNLKTLSYERIEPSFKGRSLQILSFVSTGGVFAVFFIILTYMFFDSPKEKILKRENEQLRLQFELVNKKMNEISAVMDDIQSRDNNIYRVIFEAEPIPENVRKAGFGGINRYKHLEGNDNSELLIKTQKSLDQLKKQLYIQSKSFDEVFGLAKDKEKMLASIPSIQPVSNMDLKKAAGGYGHAHAPNFKDSKVSLRNGLYGECGYGSLYNWRWRCKGGGRISTRLRKQDHHRSWFWLPNFIRSPQCV